MTEGTKRAVLQSARDHCCLIALQHLLWFCVAPLISAGKLGKRVTDLEKRKQPYQKRWISSMTSTNQMWIIRRRGKLRPLPPPGRLCFRGEMWSLSQGMVQTWLHWLKICYTVTRSVLECWLSDCPCCLNTSTLPHRFCPCQLVLSEMLPSQSVRQLVAAAMSKKQQCCDCTVSLSAL